MTVAHPKFAYEKGLHQLGNGAYAWLQPDGGWGWSNSGLIVDDDQALVVDTLFDVPLTRDMLAAYADASKAAKNINMVVNTTTMATMQRQLLLSGRKNHRTSCNGRTYGAGTADTGSGISRHGTGNGRIGQICDQLLRPVRFQIG